MKKIILVSGLVLFFVSMGMAEYNPYISEWDREENSYLWDVCKTGTVEDIEKAIANGGNIRATTYYDVTPLMLAAAYNKNPDVIVFLVDKGVDLDYLDFDGQSALMYARVFKNKRTEEMLSKLGANKNIPVPDKYPDSMSISRLSFFLEEYSQVD